MNKGRISIYSLFFLGFFWFFLGGISTVSPIYIDLVWFKELSSLHLYQRHNTIPSIFSRNFYSFEDKIFYYNQSGEIQHRIFFGEGTLISAGQTGYAIYQKVGKQIKYFNNKGQLLWKIDSFAYPLCSPSGKRLLFLSTDASSISLYDFEKNCLLQEKFLDTLILDMDFCVSTHSVVLGTSSGRIFCFDQEGKQVFLNQSTPSKFNYVKSVSYSEDGQYITSLANLAPERLTLYTSYGKKLWEVTTGLNRRKSTSIHIDTHNSLIFDQDSLHIIVRDLKNGKILYNLDFNNVEEERIRSAKIHSRKDMILVCLNTESGKKVYCYLIKKDGSFLWQKQFDDPYVLHAEISLNQTHFQIQLSRGVYCYQIQGGEKISQ